MFKTISKLVKMYVTYVELLSHGENTITSIYKWELATKQTYSNRKLTIYSKYLN